MGNFIIQDQGRKMLSGGIHHRSKEYKNGGDKEKTEKNGDIF
jgi:hypothetical protein